MNTLLSKIDTMQRAFAGAQVQRVSLSAQDTAYFEDVENPCWDWSSFNFRIRPNIKFTDRLFSQASIMEKDFDNGVWKLNQFKFNNAKSCYATQNIGEQQLPDFWDNVRLPTVAESPRNTWLVPWDDEPNSLENERCLVKYKNGVIEMIKCYVLGAIEWSNVTKIVIVETRI